MRSKNFISKYKFYFKVQMCQGRRSQIVHICKNPKTYPGPHPEPSPAGAKKNFFILRKPLDKLSGM